jgi:hypothetical protein
MTATVLMPLEVIAINANDIWRQRHEFSKQLQDLHTDVALREISHILRVVLYSKYNLYRTDIFPGRKGGTALDDRRGIFHNHTNLSPLVSEETIRKCIPIDNSEGLFAAACKSATNIRNDAEYK